MDAEYDITPHALWARGERLLEAGSLQHALVEIKKYAEQYPEEARGYAQVSHCLMRMRRHKGALSWALQALEVEPDAGCGHAARGRALAGLGRFAAAIASVERAVELEPWNLQFLSLSAWLHANHGEPKIARERIEFALKRDPTLILLHLSRAQLLRRKGEFKQATEYLEPYLADQPENSILLLNLANAHLGVDLKVAEDLYRSALAADPEQVAAREGLISLLRWRHFGFLGSGPLGHHKWVLALCSAFLVQHEPPSENEWCWVCLAFIGFSWLCRSYSNLVISFGANRNLLTEKQTKEGPVVLGTVAAGLVICPLSLKAGLVVCLLPLALELFYDNRFEATSMTLLPAVLGTYLAVWFWNPWIWCVGYILSWLLSRPRLGA